MDALPVGVAGTGTMGTGIAQLLVQTGVPAVLYDISEAALAEAERRVSISLRRAKKTLPPGRLKKTTRLEDLVSCPIVIEAAFEDLSLKKNLFSRLSTHNPGVLATNTSSLSVSRIAEAAKHPARVAGMHFFNPAPVMALVEVVRAEKTAPETLTALSELARALGKTALVCRDTPGFIVNRVALPFFLTAQRLLEAGAGSRGQIDEAVKAGGFPLGPFRLMELIGPDVASAVQRSLFEALGKPERLKPRDDSRRLSALSANEILQTVLAAVRLEARLAVEEGVAEPAAIDQALRLGMNWPKGPFEL